MLSSLPLPGTNRRVQAFLAILASAFVVACGSGDPGLSRPDVQEIVQAELAQLPSPEPYPTPSLTRADVEDAITSAVGTLPEPGLTRDEVEWIVAGAVESLPEPGVRAAEVRGAIREALESIPEPEPGLTEDRVEQIAAAAIETIPSPEPGLTEDEVERIVLAAIASIPEPQPGLSEVEVADAIRTAIDSITEPEPVLTRSDVDEIVGAAMESIPDPGVTSTQVNRAIRTAIASIPEPDTGLSRGDVRRIVASAIDDIPEPDPGLTTGEAELIAGFAVASIPPRGTQADYTRFFVNNAITRYEVQGLDATLAYYNRPESVDGQWYVFIIDQNDLVVAHYEAHRLGLDLNGWVGVDINGYRFGPEMLSATEDGKWVSYVYRNPESGELDTGAFELKNVWVVRQDGLLFASGWYIDADEFTKLLVSVAVERFRSGGLEATVAYFASPGSVLAGLEAAIDYYNAAETVEGRWFAFIGGPNGKIVAHSDPSMIGRDTQELFGGETFEVTESGAWVESESLRVWVAGYDGFVFGSGWNNDDSG